MSPVTKSRYDNLTLKFPFRAKIAEDEPRCEQLRKDNGNIRARLFATKESQTAAVQEVEQLKAEKSALNKRKVHIIYIYRYCGIDYSREL